MRNFRNAYGCTRPGHHPRIFGFCLTGACQKRSRSGTTEESYGSTNGIHDLGEGFYKVGEGSLPYENFVQYNSDAVSDRLRSQTQSNSNFLDLTMMPTENFYGRKRYLPDLNVPLLNTDAASDQQIRADPCL